MTDSKFLLLALCLLMVGGCTAENVPRLMFTNCAIRVHTCSVTIDPLPTEKTEYECDEKTKTYDIICPGTDIPANWKVPSSK